MWGTSANSELCTGTDESWRSQEARDSPRLTRNAREDGDARAEQGSTTASTQGQSLREAMKVTGTKRSKISPEVYTFSRKPRGQSACQRPEAPKCVIFQSDQTGRKPAQSGQVQRFAASEPQNPDCPLPQSTGGMRQLAPKERSDVSNGTRIGIPKSEMKINAGACGSLRWGEGARILSARSEPCSRDRRGTQFRR